MLKLSIFLEGHNLLYWLQTVGKKCHSVSWDRVHILGPYDMKDEAECKILMGDDV